VTIPSDRKINQAISSRFALAGYGFGCVLAMFKFLRYSFPLSIHVSYEFSEAWFAFVYRLAVVA